MTDEEAILLATLHAGGEIKYAGYHPDKYQYRFTIGGDRWVDLDIHETVEIISNQPYEDRTKSFFGRVAQYYCQQHNLTVE